MRWVGIGASAPCPELQMIIGAVSEPRWRDICTSASAAIDEAQGKQLEVATVSMLKRHEGDAEVSKAEIEFNRVQKVETSFTRISTGLTRARPIRRISRCAGAAHR